MAAAARVSVGSLYQYFPNKDALLVALADRHLDEVQALVERLADLDRIMINELQWHLVRLGHPRDIARLRAQLVVTTLEAVAHTQPIDPDRAAQADELANLCAAYIAIR